MDVGQLTPYRHQRGCAFTLVFGFRNGQFRSAQEIPKAHENEDSQGEGVGIPNPPRNHLARGRHGNLLHDLDAEAFQSGDFARVAGSHTDALEVKVRENLRTEAVVHSSGWRRCYRDDDNIIDSAD